MGIVYTKMALITRRSQVQVLSLHPLKSTDSFESVLFLLSFCEVKQKCYPALTPKLTPLKFCLYKIVGYAIMQIQETLFIYKKLYFGNERKLHICLVMARCVTLCSIPIYESR